MTQLTPKYDTVIFDLDGTLLYTLTDLTTAVNAAMHRFGWQERTFEEMRHFVGNGIRNLMDHAVPGGDTASKWPSSRTRSTARCRP